MHRSTTTLIAVLSLAYQCSTLHLLPRQDAAPKVLGLKTQRSRLHNALEEGPLSRRDPVPVKLNNNVGNAQRIVLLRLLKLP